MRDQVSVRRIGSEIEVKVRDQSIVIWNDDVAKYIGQELLNMAEGRPSVVPNGTRVQITSDVPEEWDEQWWPSGERGRITSSAYNSDEEQQCYTIYFEGDLEFISPDYFWREDFEVINEDQ